MPKKSRVLIIGPGYLGKPLSISLRDQGHLVHTMARTDPRIDGCEHMTADIRQPIFLNNPYDQVFYLVSAGEYSEQAYENAYYNGLVHAVDAVWRTSPKSFFIFASSTSLLSENAGGVVDEGSKIATNPMTRHLAKAETFITEHPIRSCILRFAGIYGPGRDRLATQVASGAVNLRKRPTISNRIHLHDAVGVMMYLGKVKNPKPMYLVCDSYPAPYNEVVSWLHNRLLRKTMLTYKEAETHHRRSTNKVCSNRLIMDEGYGFEYPSYKEGFLQIIQQSDYLKGLYESK